MSEILFAAEIAFRSLNRCMPQQELNLLQFATTRVAQFRAGSAQVMRRNMLQARSLATILDYVPPTFCEMPLPHTFPILATARKILPSLTPAAAVH